MKKTAIKTIRKVLLSLLCLLLVFIFGLTAWHHIRLGIEAKQIVPVGEMVNANGHAMHVAAFGEKGNGPTIVLLSGSGTAAPVYDFKVLYEQLAAHYRIVVVERSGYGYSEISGASRDIDTVMEETRAALALAGESAPYILMPHSIAGIEALYYFQTHPEEVLGIVGLDMTVPQAKDNIGMVPFANFLMSTAEFLGLSRLPFLYPIEYVGLNDAEMKQAKYLTYRNAFNRDVRNEIELTQENIDKIDLKKVRGVPILAFVSQDDESRAEHRAFAQQVPCEIVELDAPHYIHHCKSEAIANATRLFIQKYYSF